MRLTGEETPIKQRFGSKNITTVSLTRVVKGEQSLLSLLSTFLALSSSLVLQYVFCLDSFPASP